MHTILERMFDRTFVRLVVKYLDIEIVCTSLCTNPTGVEHLFERLPPCRLPCVLR
jgi:hypothetical protein